MRAMLALSLLLAAGHAAAAGDVAISYAKDMRFGNIKTFRYVAPKTTGSDSPLMAKRIVELLEARLIDSGLRETNDMPDLYVTYHLTTAASPPPDSAELGYSGYGPGWAPWEDSGLGTSRPGVSTESAGTLVVDAYRPVDKKLVWRGTGTLSPASTPIKRDQQLEKILDKLADRWKKILRDAGQ